MLIINMLIPDLLNTLFDQCNYEDMTVLKVLNKRRTNYANGYSLLRYYNQAGNTLGLICELGNIKAIKHIIFHIRTRAIQTAFETSARNGHVSVVKYLISIGANIHDDDDHALRQSAYRGKMSVVKYLVSIGADVHAYNDAAVRYSAESGCLGIVKYLVSIGANINAHDDYALRWSAFFGNLNMVKYLVSIGANIHTNDSILQRSKDNGQSKVVEYLISIGATD